MSDPVRPREVAVLNRAARVTAAELDALRAGRVPDRMRQDARRSVWLGLLAGLVFAVGGSFLVYSMGIDGLLEHDLYEIAAVLVSPIIGLVGAVLAVVALLRGSVESAPLGRIEGVIAIDYGHDPVTATVDGRAIPEVGRALVPLAGRRIAVYVLDGKIPRALAWDCVGPAEPSAALAV